MPPYRKRLYIILIVACLVGYTWVFLNLTNSFNISASSFHACIIKQATTLPCPSCGATRAIDCLLHGKPAQSLYLNPLGIIIIVLMIIIPFGVGYDLLLKKISFMNLYSKTESIIRRKWVAIPAILLIVINWIWNISKGL
jgi:hypothetical protein